MLKLLIIISLLSSEVTLALTPLVANIGTSLKEVSPLDELDLNGTAAEICSGGIIKFKGQSESEKAIYITNDHCIIGSKPGKFTYNQKYDSRSVTVIGKDGRQIVKPTRIIYSSLTVSDFALIELEKTYKQLSDEIGLDPFLLSDQELLLGTAVKLPSAIFNRTLECNIDLIVYRLREGEYEWSNSFRYDNCVTRPGWSGTIVVDPNDRVMLGIHNTGANENYPCSINSPCEVSPDGSTQYYKNRKYGQ